ncbi:MAG: GNAT family N-acetyltransferase, partial [Bacteroidota bacterium]
MKEIVPPVERQKLIDELTEDKFVRDTNYGHNELYIFSHKDSPYLMREVGRLRELSFRTAGGGTGKDCDIDEYDISDDPYQQLIVWDPKHKEIMGGYRMYIPREGQTPEEIEKRLVTTHLFEFSDDFRNNYLPYMIELGRSFVQPAYQTTNRARKGIYALDNLWDGLGSLVVDNPTMKYFFGKVTMYPHFNTRARDLILYFLKKHFP